MKALLIKYIISWCLVITVQDPCPGLSYKDEYGRTVNGNISCLVLHSHTETECGHSKVFYNRDSATVFYNNILAESGQIYFGLDDKGIAQVEMDSIIIK